MEPTGAAPVVRKLKRTRYVEVNGEWIGEEVPDDEDSSTPDNANNYLQELQQAQRRDDSDTQAPLLKKVGSVVLEAAKRLYAGGDVPGAMELVEVEMARSLE